MYNKMEHRYFCFSKKLREKLIHHIVPFNRKSPFSEKRGIFPFENAKKLKPLRFPEGLFC